MLPLLSDIKNKRKAAGLTQAQLAKVSGVSQSLIAKIESGRAEANYGNAKKLFDALEEIEKQTTRKARDVMNAKIIAVDERDNVKRAVELMRKQNISQLPVLDKNMPVGSISEKEVLDEINNTGSVENVLKKSVGEIMDENYPQIDENTSARTAAFLLHEHQAVLVTKNGRLKGIITKADVLKN